MVDPGLSAWVHRLAGWLQAIAVPVCAIAAWGLSALTLWTLYTIARSGTRNVRRLHQIPCAHCQYFTGDYLLKCTVRPSQALSEAAIACPDYQAAASLDYPMASLETSHN